MTDDIRQNTHHVLNEINDAAYHSGRSMERICLVAVCKRQPVDKILAAIDAGINNLAENYPEQAVEKILSIGSSNITWHMIGHIQSKKCKLVAANFQVIHSIDKMDTLRRIDTLLDGTGRKIEYLLEINIAGEENKSGYRITQGGDLGILDEVFNQASDLKNTRIRGLMVMPPYVEESEDSRKYFKQARGYLLALQQKYNSINLDYLSMGTSQDYKIAIEEGATHVRIGTAIFGKR